MRYGLVLVGLAIWLLGGCVQATLAPASQANWTPRDRQFLANAPYARVSIPGEYQRHIVDYNSRKEAPGTIVVDTNNRYLYYVLPKGQAIRYGVTVGEEALAFSGVARVGAKEEWPAWVPTQEIKHRLANIPDYVGPGPHNPMGARALYLSRRQGHALPHSRDQSAGIYRPRHLVGVHPYDQRRRDRSLQSGEDRHARCGISARSGRICWLAYLLSPHGGSVGRAPTDGPLPSRGSLVESLRRTKLSRPV